MVNITILHELTHCHEDDPANQKRYQPVREHLFERFADESVAVRYHLVTIWVQWAVMQRVFPDRFQTLRALTTGHPLLERTAEILRNHQAQLSLDDPLGSLLTLLLRHCPANGSIG